jgi:DNA repair and recombination protein RAD54B
MFGVLKTPRRIILSGTPIQNDLGEFHAMVKIKQRVWPHLA